MEEPGCSVCHVVSSLHPAAGGPSRTVVRLCDALADVDDMRITLMYQSRPQSPSVASENGDVDRRVAVSDSATALALGLPLRRLLLGHVDRSRPDLIHSHGIWLPLNCWVARIAKKMQIPHIVHPRGMLEPWALGYKAVKKNLAMSLYQRRNLDDASVLVATAWSEYENLRSLGFTRPIAVIPNGVPRDEEGPRIDRPTRTVREPRKVLFLSRVQAKKGLLNLVRAWSEIAQSGWHLQIAGPSEGGHLKDVVALIDELRIASLVSVLGEVDGISKSDLYRGADVFVLPTFSENFGVVVAEALSYGLPVITTKGAPWADLETFGCGWWIDIGVDPLVRALRQAMSMTDDERRLMGERGRLYVQRFDWKSISLQTSAVYGWILGGGPKPDCVQLN
jgi:glycosyltransferase involved in cell wall biosynthesis